MSNLYYQPTITSRLQSDFQAYLRPGLFSLLPHLHTHTTEWVLENTTKDEAVDLVLKAAVTLKEKLQLTEPYIDPEGDVRIFSYTKAEWLDIMEFGFEQQGQNTLIHGHSFSSGVLPTSVPFAPVMNAALFFLPFSDHGMNKMRLKRFRELTLEPAKL